MGLLSGGTAALFGELFAPLYLPAVLTQVVETHDERGKLRREQTERNCRAQVDRCTERMVAAEGYSDTDQAIFILSGSLAGSVEPGQVIDVQDGPYAGQPFRIALPIDRDPGTAYWLARGVRVKNG